MLPYALTIFTGAFLLFQVQPLIGKYILPWFGGGPGVWTTCLLFFQTLLLGGYAYAHFTSTRLRPRQQAWVHLALLALSVALLPITPSDSWKAQLTGNPTWHILLLLTATIGLPYFVLSSTGPLMQQWFSQTNPGVSPYRLYALSNVGSLLALLTYPVFVEVRFTRHEQTVLWSVGLGLFVLFCGYCALRLWRHSRAATGPVAAPASAPADAPPLPTGEEGTSPDGTPEETPPAAVVGMIVAPEPAASSSTTAAADPVASATASPVDKLFWISLPAIASILLMATTNKLCQEVAVIPFLWVLPLSLYLLSFIISFDHARWYHRGIFAALLVVGIAVVCEILPVGHDAPIHVQIIGYTVTLFAACMVCHGELYRLRPAPRYLTSYFLCVAAGGALGGFLVAVIAPLVFKDFRELQIGLWVLSYSLGVLCFQQRSRQLAMGAAVGALAMMLVVPWVKSYFDDSDGAGAEYAAFFRSKAFYLVAGLVLMVACLVDVRRRALLAGWQPRMAGFVMALSVALGVVFVVQWSDRGTVRILTESRNFYGTVKVFDYYPDDPEDNYRLLLHGATTHGLQFQDPARSVMPTTYYAEVSGVGLAIDNLPEGPRKIGLVGLGTGTLAIYGRTGDTMRMYEIDPAVERLARSHFTYLENCQAQVDVVMGDARVSLERELARDGSQEYDILVLDAFSSDAIPVHLLTKEAFEVYLAHLKPDGVLAVHISNRYLNLRPVVERLAAHFDLGVSYIAEDLEPDWWIYSTSWMLVTANRAFLEQPAISNVADEPETLEHPALLWTDDYTNLFSLLK